MSCAALGDARQRRRREGREEEKKKKKEKGGKWKRKKEKKRKEKEREIERESGSERVAGIFAVGGRTWATGRRTARDGTAAGKKERAKHGRRKRKGETMFGENFRVRVS